MSAYFEEGRGFISAKAADVLNLKRRVVGDGIFHNTLFGITKNRKLVYSTVKNNIKE